MEKKESKRKKPIILTTKQTQDKCPHNKRKHISSFSNRILVCDMCGKFFNRYKYKNYGN